VSHRVSKCATYLLSAAITIYFICGVAAYAYGQAADESALRQLTEKFFAAYRKPDIDALMALWSEKSPDYTASRQSLQKSFAANRIELKSATPGKLTLAGDKASLRVVVDSSAIEIVTGQPAIGFGRLNRTLHFIKEGEVWKVSRYTASEEELAAAIVVAKTDKERKDLLEADKELLTIALQRALANHGDRLRRSGKYTQALSISQLSLTLAQKLNDKAGMAMAFRSIGAAYYLQGDFTQALEQHHKGLKIAEELNDKTAIGNALNGLGNVYNAQGNYSQSLSHYQKSLQIREELGDKSGIGSTLGNLGISHFEMGNYAEALEFNQRALKISEELGNITVSANALHIIARVYTAQGNYAQAWECHQKSLKLHQEADNKEGIAASLVTLGLLLKEQGNYLQAMEFCLSSLKIAEEIGDKVAISAALDSTGSIYFLQGNYTQALEHLKKSLKISQEIGDQTGTSITLSNIGDTYVLLGDSALALQYYQRSLKLKEEVGDKDGIANLLTNMGDAYLEQANHTKALQCYQESLRIGEEIGNKPMMANALNSLGNIYRKQGKAIQALESANKAVAIARQTGEAETFWKASTTMGQAYRAVNQLDRAGLAFAEAIATIEDLRTQVAGTEQQQQQFFESKISPYYEMIDLLIGQSNWQEALAFAERSKGRTLLDVLSNGKINITKALFVQEQQQESNLTAELASLNSQIYKEKQRQKPDQTRLAELTARLEKTRLQMDAFQTNLYASHPELRIQRGQIQPLSATEAALLIPDNNTALLEFVVQENQSFLFVLTRSNKLSQAATKLQVYKLNLSRKDLTDLTRRFNQRITSRSLGFQELATQLYDWLLKPAQAQLRGINRLVIVPDGVLWELPFQALLSAPRRFLLEDYTISYAPSLTVLKEMQALRAKRRNSKSRTNTLLALGNPAIGTQTAEKVTAVFMDERLLPLPEAERQVKALQQIYGSKNSKIYIGTQATEERLKQEAGHYQILHLATHGILNDASPMYSHLVLSQLQGNATNDGLLEAWEIMKLDLNADLVILSACDTARGRVGAGEGMIGLAWSLFVAGSPTTVVSQWKVETESNSELMVAFHRNLRLNANNAKAPVSKAEALRRAALKLMKNPKYSHPFYWTPFVIIGDAN
jgi:CHAT domain-containing protein/tetratricopeptide (TPR) repeat protein